LGDKKDIDEVVAAMAGYGRNCHNVIPSKAGIREKLDLRVLRPEDDNIKTMSKILITDAIGESGIEFLKNRDTISNITRSYL